MPARRAPRRERAVPSRPSSVHVGLELPLKPREAFDVLVDELVGALGRRGLHLDPRGGGRLTDAGHDTTLGQIDTWSPGVRVRLAWRSPGWEPEAKVEVDARFERIPGGTRVTINQLGWATLVGGSADELAGWFASEVVGPIVQSMTPDRLADWITDRRARRPSGDQARTTYRDPLYHRPNFLAILEALDLTRDDHLLEVGCGGGAFLHDALKSGCRAAAIDHSPEMVELASETNRDAIKEGRLTIVEAEADRLPLPDATFTCAVMTGVFGFLPDPVAALREIHRTLRARGRLVVYTSNAALRGTPATPEPIASRVHFYEDEELAGLAESAGFRDVTVEEPPNFERHARAVGVPEEAIAYFRGRGGGQFLRARKGP